VPLACFAGCEEIEDFSPTGVGVRGGVECREREEGFRPIVSDCKDEYPVGVGGGVTVMARNVSTKRDLMTFSRPVCELSGNMLENGMGTVDVEGPDVVKCELTEDERELVLGLCPGFTVGADPLVE
jgi:hypothetical protein